MAPDVGIPPPFLERSYRQVKASPVVDLATGWRERLDSAGRIFTQDFGRANLPPGLCSCQASSGAVPKEKILRGTPGLSTRTLDW